MEQLFATLINVAFYIFIFKLISGAFPKRNKEKGRHPVEKQEAPIKQKKKNKSFFEEALEQLKKLEEISKEQENKKSKKFKPVPQAALPVIKPEPVKYINDEFVEPGVKKRKVIDEKSEEIYYNSEESDYKLKREDLKKAIVYSEIISKPVSRRIGMPYRR